MSGARCLLCGYNQPLWIGDAARSGECLVIGGAAICEEAQTRARAEGMRRKVCPEAFDLEGRIRQGGDWLGVVCEAMDRAGLCMWTGLPVARREFRKIPPGEPVVR